MFRLMCWIFALSLTVSSASANAPPPELYKELTAPAKPAAGVSVPVEVSYAKPNGNPAAKIVIPLATLKALAESAKVNQSITLPVSVADPDPTPPTSGFPHGGTIIAGLAISLAMVSMVYLLRRKPSRKWAVTGTAVAVIGIGVTSYLWADIRVPGQPYNGPARRPEPVVPVVEPQPAGPMVTIEIVEKGDKIVITVPPAGQ